MDMRYISITRPHSLEHCIAHYNTTGPSGHGCLSAMQFQGPAMIAAGEQRDLALLHYSICILSISSCQISADKEATQTLIAEELYSKPTLVRLGICLFFLYCSHSVVRIYMYTLLLLLEHLTVSISVDYSPPNDFNGSLKEYRAASGPVTVTCTATGPGTGAASCQWSSTCRNCPFRTATTCSIKRAAVHSGDTGTHTCVATRGGVTANASIDFRVVGKSRYL